MTLNASYSIPAPRQKVFAALIDPAILQRLIEGCEKIVKTGENTYDAHLKLGIAGFKRSYVGKVQLQDLVPPESYTLVIEGKAAPGFVKSTARVQLVEQGESTELRCAADAQVGGLMAAIGSRLIDDAAKKMLDEFFRKFAEVMAAPR